MADNVNRLLIVEEDEAVVGFVAKVAKRVGYTVASASTGARFVQLLESFQPSLVIMELLGVPRSELARVKRLSDDIALFIGSSRGAAEKYAAAESATKEMTDFFRTLIAARRAAPQADVLSELVHVEDAGDRLTEDELIATCILLLFAGHETTTNHIANGLAALMRFPGEMARLRADSRADAASAQRSSSTRQLPRWSQATQ